MLDVSSEVATVIEGWRPRGASPAAGAFAKKVVFASAPGSAGHARTLLWCCSRLALFGEDICLPLAEEVLLSPSFVERFVTDALIGRSPTRLRSVRTNLRFVGRRVVPLAWPPDPLSLPRNHSKAPYSAREIAALCRLCDAQPTESRRQRLSGLICLGAGAGLSGPDMRSVRGIHVVQRSGGLLVIARGRVAPVLTSFHSRLICAARFAGADFVIGGAEETRKNLTSRLVASVAGGIELPRIELGRLRATWLCTQAEAFSLRALFAAGGFSHSQYLGDVVAMCRTPSEEEIVRLCGGREGAG